MRITRARRDCSYPFRIGRRWSCQRTTRSRSCVLAPRRLHSFPLCTSSPRRRLERRASKRGHRHFTDTGYRRLSRWGQLRQAANVRRADGRFGAHWQTAAVRVFNTHGRTDGDYLTAWAAFVAPATTPRSAVGGDWTRTSPVTLLQC